MCARNIFSRKDAKKRKAFPLIEWVHIRGNPLVRGIGFRDEAVERPGRDLQRSLTRGLPAYRNSPSITTTHSIRGKAKRKNPATEVTEFLNALSCEGHMVHPAEPTTKDTALPPCYRAARWSVRQEGVRWHFIIRTAGDFTHLCGRRTLCQPVTQLLHGGVRTTGKDFDPAIRPVARIAADSQ